MPIYLDTLADLLKERAGQPWRPSNGFEGDLFEEKVCSRCDRSDGWGCQISLAAMCHDTHEPEYPTEWVYGLDAQPSCTAFEAKEPTHDHP